MSSLTLPQPQKRFGRVDVIRGVDLEVEDGEFVVFVRHRPAAASPRCCG